MARWTDLIVAIDDSVTIIERKISTAQSDQTTIWHIVIISWHFQIMIMGKLPIDCLIHVVAQAPLDIVCKLTERLFVTRCEKCVPTNGLENSTSTL